MVIAAVGNVKEEYLVMIENMRKLCEVQLDPMDWIPVHDRDRLCKKVWFASANGSRGVVNFMDISRDDVLSVHENDCFEVDKVSRRLLQFSDDVVGLGITVIQLIWVFDGSVFKQKDLHLLYGAIGFLGIPEERRNDLRIELYTMKQQYIPKMDEEWVEGLWDLYVSHSRCIPQGIEFTKHFSLYTVGSTTFLLQDVGPVEAVRLCFVGGKVNSFTFHQSIDKLYLVKIYPLSQLPLALLSNYIFTVKMDDTFESSGALDSLALDQFALLRTSGVNSSGNSFQWAVLAREGSGFVMVLLANERMQMRLYNGILRVSEMYPEVIDSMRCEDEDLVMENVLRLHNSVYEVERDMRKRITECVKVKERVPSDQCVALDVSRVNPKDLLDHFKGMSWDSLGELSALEGFDLSSRPNEDISVQLEESMRKSLLSSESRRKYVKRDKLRKIVSRTISEHCSADVETCVVENVLTVVKIFMQAKLDRACDLSTFTGELDLKRMAEEETLDALKKMRLC